MTFIKHLFTAIAALWLLAVTLIMLPLIVCLMPLLIISKRHFSEWVLFSFAILTALGLYPIGFVYRAIKWKGFIAYLRRVNIIIDVGGNIIADELFNDNFITNSSLHRFGVVRETISDNLGENERDETLSTFGKRFTNLLSVFDFDHAKNSIVEDHLP